MVIILARQRLLFLLQLLHLNPQLITHVCAIFGGVPDSFMRFTFDLFHMQIAVYKN